ncbi:unnamed protein product [Sphenostylis stenocarpa]|uniref:Uncharacterized protein n=1 Tax=Sphenostylis stenocarpa TaxID=92480 RepID=A0AA86VNP5_9FABA|nr:unnamed protein product [Sphenostylis stenocarpa]
MTNRKEGGKEWKKGSKKRPNYVFVSVREQRDVCGADRFGGDGASRQKHATFSSHHVGPRRHRPITIIKNIVRGRKWDHMKEGSNQTRLRER